MTDNENKRRIDDRLPGQPLVWDEESAQEQIVSLHRQLAAEKLRADQGWQRAEAKSRECIELRERLAAAHPVTEVAERIPAEVAIAVPRDVRAALDRMCQPLHESRLSGVTAQEDARCMGIIKRFVDRLAEAPATAGQSQKGEQQ